MDIDVFGGSKGGGARTVSSVLLAAGAQELGLHPIHIQVLPPGRTPVLDGVQQVPFDMAVVTANDGDLVAAQIRLHRQGRHGPVIVDMPCQRIRETMLMLAGIEARILLPMREGSPEIQRAIHDYRDAQDEVSGHGSRRQWPDRWKPLAWLLPVGWPPSLRPADFKAILHNRGLRLSDLRPISVISPGIPRFDQLDLDFTGPEDCFELTDQQQDAAVRLAQALYTPASGLRLINR
jgi:hypothetical protein